MRAPIASMALMAIGVVQGQAWCPPGAHWSFGYSNVNWQTGETLTGVLLADYQGDTLVGGEVAQRIDLMLYYELVGSGNPMIDSWGSRFTYYSTDVVHIWNTWSGQYDTLLWFGAAPGQTWPVVGLPPDYRFEVLDTASAIVDGVALRRSVIQIQGPNGPIAPIDTLHERIGFNFLYLFSPGSILVDGDALVFRCYEDDEISYHHPNVQDCGFTAAVAENMVPAVVSAHPNPGCGRLFVDAPRGAMPMEALLVNPTGRLVARVPFTPGNSIDVDGLGPGHYIIRILDRNGNWIGQASWIKL